MPLPFILGAAAIIAGATGVKKGIDANEKNNRAKDIINDANALVTATKRTAEQVEKDYNESLQNLGQARLDGMQRINRFVTAFSQIKNISLSNTNIGNLKEISISKDELKKMKALGIFGVEVVSGMAQGAVGGGLAALGAYGGTMTFAAASTGTAISALSGAAATNATLAALGGGSLAAGGLGMLGGTAVLAGLVAGPALAIAGFTMNSKAQENLENARAAYAKAKAACERAQIDIDKFKKVTELSNTYLNLTVNLNTIFLTLITRLEDIIYQSGVDFIYYSENDKKIVAMSMAVAKAVKTVIEVSLLTKNNNLNEDAKRALPLYIEKERQFHAQL